MTNEEKWLARVIFQKQVHSLSGQAYEDFFSTIMQHANSNFRQIKPQGQFGDRKNDGYDPTTGCYHQVFAPDDTRKKPTDAVKKANTDFKGLKTFWQSICPIKSYKFVLNDRYRGSFPEIEQTLALIKRDHTLDDASSLLARHLEDIALNLPDDKIVAIVGIIPSPSSMVSVKYSILNDIITHVMNLKIPIDVSQILSAPDFDKKISFNGLSRPVGSLLITASYQRSTVDDFFRRNSSFIKQSLRDSFNQMYLDASRSIPISEPSPPSRGDRIFFEILHKATPGPSKTSKDVQDAVLVLMAYYFESCDIFEDPK